MQDIKIIILVASEQEKEVLLHKDLYKMPGVDIIVTGYGSRNVIKAIREYAFDDIQIYNIGLCAGTEHVPTDTLINVTASMPGFNYGNFQQPIKLKLLSTTNAFPCISAPGFINDVKQFFPNCCYSPAYVVDMELYTIASYFDNVIGLKVVSDSGDLDDYLQACEDFDAFEHIRKQILELIKQNLLSIQLLSEEE